VVPLFKKPLFIFICIFFLSFGSFTVALASNENTVTAILTMEVSTTVKPSEQTGTPIKGARLIVINSLGEIIANVLTDSKGKARVAITIPKDFRFPEKNMGEVTVMAFANGYNESLNFSVPINEFNDNRARVHFSLWEIDPKRRNEPGYINGSYHRFTVFKMLDYYAQKIGLDRQKIKDESVVPPPWSPDYIKK
jgi:hypothetical protein